ncbi:hypothetical protein BC629DRAFT_1164301 [Irpex lacteus]|nr:hypothetical protein BC629DRAFT_1164301 [Irpex lacteus]
MPYSVAFLSTIFISLLVSQYTSAAPAVDVTNSTDTAQAAAAEANIFACTDAHFNGNCQSITIGNNECLTFPSALQKDISSIVLFNGGAYGCEGYVDVACFSDQGNLFFSGAEVDLSTTSFNDRLSSVICSYNL